MQELFALDDCEATDYDKSHFVAVCNYLARGCGANTGKEYESAEDAASHWNRRA